uniref:G-patch domain-containing protein n=1 Tax=Syphacia muris TaxID=451379 RepID=A0A0N5ABU9_9BILA
MDKETDSIPNVILETVSSHFWETVLPGFRFLDVCQLFYNPESGYYYDQNSSLFYHPSTKCYYFFDDKTAQFVFYSRVPSEHHWESKRARQRAICLYGESFVNGMEQFEVDVFEVLDSLLFSVCSNLSDKQILGILPENDVSSSSDDEVTQFIEEERIRYPPCIRMIDQKGALYVITIDGAKIGVGQGCDIQVKNVENDLSREARIEVLAEISYTESCGFVVKPCTSSVHMFLNDSAINNGEQNVLQHNDICSIADNFFSIHIHHGSNTCNGCEPGVVLPIETESTSSNSIDVLSGERLRRRNLKAMKAKYGLIGEHRREDFMKKHSKGNVLNTRASKPSFPQQALYSDSIYSHCVAKPLPNQQIVESNEDTIQKDLLSNSKGHKLLCNLGWSEGESLGKNDNGIKEPVIFM